MIPLNIQIKAIKDRIKINQSLNYLVHLNTLYHTIGQICIDDRLFKEGFCSSPRTEDGRQNVLIKYDKPGVRTKDACTRRGQGPKDLFSGHQTYAFNPIKHELLA